VEYSSAERSCGVEHQLARQDLLEKAAPLAGIVTVPILGEVDGKVEEGKHSLERQDGGKFVSHCQRVHSLHECENDRGFREQIRLHLQPDRAPRDSPSPDQVDIVAMHVHLVDIQFFCQVSGSLATLIDGEMARCARFLLAGEVAVEEARAPVLVLARHFQ
jgi:hypothetical protein